MALLRAMHERRGRGEGRLAVAHFNHRLRGGQSDADEQFVVELCGSLGLDCHVGRAEGTPIESAGDGLEATARAGRYAFLRQTAERIHARYVVTAHTADDQAETILHHVMRGTGLAGLEGIARVLPLGPAVSLVRPLLDASRAEVIDYLSSLDQPFCQDATNDDWQFTRNRIRHELLPLLARDYSPGVVAALVRLGALARDAQDVLEAVGEASLDRSLVESDAARLVLDCRALDAEHRHVVREMLIAAWRRQVCAS